MADIDGYSTAAWNTKIFMNFFLLFFLWWQISNIDEGGKKIWQVAHVIGAFLKSSKILYCYNVSGAFSDILLVDKKL